MAKLSKRMKKTYETLDTQENYTLDDAISILGKIPKVKFDETVELHFHLTINPKSSDQIVRGTVSLPHGTGKTIRVAVICKGESEQVAKDAGADFVGSKDLIDKISNGFLDFDVLISTPDMMRDLSRLGKILGPRGLMPTPKAGTVTQDVAKAIKDVKAGKIEFKSDKQAGIHVGVGKVSFSPAEIAVNAREVMDAVLEMKPASVKGNLIKSLSVSTTMGPGLRVQI